LTNKTLPTTCVTTCICIPELVIQHADTTFSELYCIVICGHLPLPYFSTLSHKRHNFWTNVIEHKMCGIWFSLKLLPEIFLILRTTQWDIKKKNYIRLQVKNTLFLSHWNQLESSWQIFFLNSQISNIIKTHSVGIQQLLHADRWTAGQAWQIIVAFQNFSNTSKKNHIHFITVRNLVPYRANEPNMSSHLHTTKQTPILPNCSKFYISVIFMRLQWQSVSQISSSLHKNKMHTFLVSNKKKRFSESDIQQ